MCYATGFLLHDWMLLTQLDTCYTIVHRPINWMPVTQLDICYTTGYLFHNWILLTQLDTSYTVVYTPINWIPVVQLDTCYKTGYLLHNWILVTQLDTSYTTGCLLHNWIPITQLDTSYTIVYRPIKLGICYTTGYFLHNWILLTLIFIDRSTGYLLHNSQGLCQRPGPGTWISSVVLPFGVPLEGVGHPFCCLLSTVRTEMYQFFDRHNLTPLLPFVCCTEREVPILRPPQSHPSAAFCPLCRKRPTNSSTATI